MRANAANFLQIWVNLQKYWNNVMSTDGLILEYMDLSHIHLAVPHNHFTLGPTNCWGWGRSQRLLSSLGQEIQAFHVQGFRQPWCIIQPIIAGLQSKTVTTKTTTIKYNKQIFTRNLHFFFFSPSRLLQLETSIF